MKHIIMLHDIKKHHDFEKGIHDILKDVDYHCIYTHSIQESIQYIKDYPTPARFYAVGGDGTVNGILQGIVNTKHELVVIPYGTGNDFCRVLTKEKNPYHLLKQSLKMSSQKVDTILLNDHYYINSACFGVDSVIANHVHDTPDILLVPQSKSYLVSIMQHVFQYNYHRVKLYSENQCLYDGPTTLCTLNNGQYYGGGFQITPQADIQDGYMDICVVDQIPKAKIPYMFSLLIAHKLENRKEVHYFKMKKATLHCEYMCNLDGETYQSDVYHFEVKPQSLNLVMYE